MKHSTFILILFLVSLQLGSAQSETSFQVRDFPIIISLQFNAFTLPFRNVQSHFSNFGIGIGTEVNYKRNGRWAQKVMASWYRNRAAGDGLLLQTQLAYRPSTNTDFFSELALGAGYFYGFRPVQSFRQKEGRWQSLGKKGKGMLAIPVGLQLGYDSKQSSTYSAPFVGYQFHLLRGYNDSVPVAPGAFLQLGSRTFFN